MARNALEAFSYYNVTAKPNVDGSCTINFGAWQDSRINCRTMTPGWSYTIRMYQSRKEILDGTWSFPKPVKWINQ